MIDIIVWSAIGILAAFTGVWLLRPDLRAWIEQPKYRFLEQAKQFEKQR
jgi:hypothetical protein